MSSTVHKGPIWRRKCAKRPAAAQNLLRISVTAAHTEAHVERLIETLVRVADSLGIER